MDIDTPLDEVISKARKDRKASRKAKASARTTSSTTKKARNQATATVRSGSTGEPTAVSTKPTQGLPPDATKIVVSGLPDDVNEASVRDLFSSTIGPVKKASLSFNSQGRSTGYATIEFKRIGDGSKACAQYNGRLIDNKRPMKVEIIVDPARVPKPPLASRVAPAAKEAKAQASVSNAEKKRSAGKGKSKKGKGKGRSGESKPKPLTAEELDAQMDAYVADGTAATA